MRKPRIYINDFSELVVCPKCKKQRYPYPVAHGMCDPCYATSLKPYRHGLTTGQAEQIWVDQDGKCQICSVPIYLDSLSVDHDHKCCAKVSCGKCVRGFLCHKCNVGLGFFRDNANLCRNAAQYLEKSQQLLAPATY